MLPLLYTAELALDDEDIDGFLRWYAFRHAPDLYPIGFQVCTCYRAVIGDMTFLDVYEIPNWEIFTTRGYARMAERDVYAAEILAKRRNKAHTIYKQHRLDQTNAEKRESLDSDWISAIRFDSLASGDDLMAELTSETALLVSEGASAVRFAERTRDHPTYTTHRPRFLLLTEWTSRPKVDRALLIRLEQRLGAAATNASLFLGQRVYPWPDTPA